jgi:hypothetical protein
MSEIQAADSGARKYILWLIVIVTIFALGALILSDRYESPFMDWLNSDAARLEQKLNWVLIVFLVPLLPLLVVIVYFWRFGSAVIGSRRFPPPGYSVIRDTPVIEGNKAKTRGALIKLIAIVLGFFLVGVPVMFWLVIRSMLGT